MKLPWADQRAEPSLARDEGMASAELWGLSRLLTTRLITALKSLRGAIACMAVRSRSWLAINCRPALPGPERIRKALQVGS